jgi:SAM-dependent methyltransferase
MKIKLNKRTKCRLCDAEDLKLAVKMQPIPPQELYLPSAEMARSVEAFPVDIYWCSACGHVQQLDVLNSEVLWVKYTYQSGKAKGMPEHFQEFANQAFKQPNDFVVDIGSNDGSLLAYFKQAGCRVLGVDPAKELALAATEKGIETLPLLFDQALAAQIVKQYGKADIITCFNAFAHADNLAGIVTGIKTLLAQQGTFYFEAQYLRDVIDKTLIGTIFHEHMSHHALIPLKGFLERHGLQITDVVRHPIQHGSILGTVKHIEETHLVAERVDALLSMEENDRLNAFETIHSLEQAILILRKDAADFKEKVRKEGEKVIGFGAARSGQTLINQLNLNGVIEYIVDDHPEKLNKYPAGDGLKIRPVKTLYQEMPDYVIILAWVHVEKIIQEHIEYLRKGGRFVLLTPKIEVIDIEAALLRKTLNAH